MFFNSKKSVHVSAYTRTRKGKLEYVCTHWRAPPGLQQSLIN
jgi:hypothetical protein